MSKTGGGRGTNGHRIRGVGITRQHRAVSAPPPLLIPSIAEEPENDHGTHLDVETMHKILAAVARCLGPGPEVEMILTGGAYMALRGMRGMTFDMDSPTRLSKELGAAVARALADLGFPSNTLNSNAAMFTSAVDLDTGRVELYRAGRLVVFGPSADSMLLLKLRASRPVRDVHDILLLLPLTTFRTSQEVVDRYKGSFPEEPDDEYLGSYIGGLAKKAGMSWPGL